jgi:signal transduction histidine kinase
MRVNSVGNIGFLEVIDTGMGISPGALPQVFERFFRAEEARANRFAGSGLGLAIVKSITDAHRGSIQIRSSERNGTTVRVELALAAPEKDKSNGKAHLVS